MDKGFLGIEKFRVDRFSRANDFPTRVSLTYGRFLESSEFGAEVLRKIEADPRAKSLEGRGINLGSSASGYCHKYLAMWHLWAINEHGRRAADSGLDAFLNAEKITVLNTLWILGVEVSAPICLGHGIRIVPVKDMPDSREKEHYLKFDRSQSGPMHPKPNAALVTEVNVDRACDPNLDSNLIRQRNEAYFAASRMLSDAAHIINAIEGLSCTPYFSTSYCLPNSPLGLFAGSGGGYPVYDVLGSGSTKIGQDQSGEIDRLLAGFRSLEGNRKKRFRRILSRLSQSKRREEIADKILDLCVALEMSLLDDNSNTQQLSLSFRLRGSWLIARDPTERIELYRKLRTVYDLRCQVAHTGALLGSDPQKIMEASRAFPEYCRIAEKIVAKLILDGEPNWTELILGLGP